MKSHPCPLCGVVQLEDMGLPMRRVYWTDKCACSDDHPCVAHSMDPEGAPDRPSHEEMVERSEAQRNRGNERVSTIIQKFAEYYTLRARVAELEGLWSVLLRLESCLACPLHDDPPSVTDAIQIIKETLHPK